ncbi:MAG: type III-B CRISPR module RAMP protein Cmr4 [Bacteroidota bacterium]
MQDLRTHVYLIRALTNMHPGSGDNDYGIVDKLVQRDPTSGAPTIHTSGIKGALRQYFADQFGEDGHNHSFVTTIFGSKPQSSDFKQGEVRFISADLLTIPVINEGTVGGPYLLVHDETILERWEQKVSVFQGKDWSLNGNKSQLGKPNSERFQRRYQELPVIARNYLDNGESKNLWYEEIVPRESIFGFILQGPESILEDIAKGNSEQGAIGIDGKVVQLGANATVGYGYCLFTKIA